MLERVRELSFDLELSDYASGTMSPFSLRKPREGGGSDPAVPEDLTTPEEVTGPVNIGNPMEFSMLELATLVIELTGARSRIVHRPLL